MTSEERVKARQEVDELSTIGVERKEECRACGCVVDWSAGGLCFTRVLGPFSEEAFSLCGYCAEDIDSRISRMRKTLGVTG